MLTFARPADAIEFGLAMDRFVDAEPQFPALHIGAHQGSVLYREGDYVGAQSIWPRAWRPVVPLLQA
jgi:class 3 adenylate cyclase